MFYLFKRPKVRFHIKKTKTTHCFSLSLVDAQNKHLAICGTYATQANAEKAAHDISRRLTDGTKPPSVSICFEQT